MHRSEQQAGIERQQKRQLILARRNSAVSVKRPDEISSVANLKSANTQAYIKSAIRPVRSFVPQQGRKIQAQQARVELSTIRAQERLREFQQKNSSIALRSRLNALPQCRRSSFLFVYALAATNLVLSLYKTILIFISDSIVGSVGGLSLLVPIVGQVLSGVSELVGLAVGITIGLVLGVIQFSFSIYIFFFIRKRTTLASRQVMNLAVIALSMLPIIELIPWVFLRLRHIHNEEKKNCRKRDEIMKRI